jgi:hypothetical protein
VLVDALARPHDVGPRERDEGMLCMTQALTEPVNRPV